jgi:Zn-dependent M28 family amino/carboxypeptidase
MVSGGNQQVILLGSHLDSVEAGPGINDNGSGTAANLEIAIQFSKYFGDNKQGLANNYRFCWWGAEEMGLLGSTYYVSQLTSRDKRVISANLNLDMIGSPNKFYGIYNGSMADEPIRKQSEYIASLFADYMVSAGGGAGAAPLPYDLIPFDGRSDYGPFIANGTHIAAGGLFTGAEALKSEEDRKRYGGLTNAAFDPCYHQACDTLDNVDMDALLVMSKASAYVTEKLYRWNGQ